MKQINARIPEEMHRAIKMKAAKEGKTMTDVIMALLEQWIENITNCPDCGAEIITHSWCPECDYDVLLEIANK